MTIEDRRQRDRIAQRQLITSTARSIAEQEGWDAVTTRRLSAEIEYSQPVIYKHFASLDDLVEAVALEGFGELAEFLGRARRTASPSEVVAVVGRAYSAWAIENPALYDAMFTRATRLTFGSDDTPASMSASYTELRSAVSTVAGERDVETLTEVWWATLHGLTTLGRDGRLRPDFDADRTDIVVASLRPSP